MFLTGLNTLQLIEELGLQNDVVSVLRSEAAAKNRMLFVDGKLHSLPNSLSSLFKVGMSNLLLTHYVCSFSDLYRVVNE